MTKDSNDSAINDALSRLGPARREPTQQMRKLAKTLADIYAALVQEGFTESQALEIVGGIVSTSLQVNQKKDTSGPGTEGGGS